MICLAAFLLSGGGEQDSGAGRLQWGAIVMAGVGDPVHPKAHHPMYVLQESAGLEIGTSLAGFLDVFGEFDLIYTVPVPDAPNFVFLNGFAGFRAYPLESSQGLYFMAGAGQSWNNSEAGRFQIKEVQTRFNFGLHVALGWRFSLTGGSDLLLELRFSHWSNGSFTGDRNQGLNTLLLGAELLFR